MNYEMYLPIYGNYLQVERMLSDEQQSKSFGVQVSEAVLAGSISGATFGISLHMFPTRGSVVAAQTMVRGLSSIPKVAPIFAPVVLAAANFAVIESAPGEQQRGLWQMFSSALTGTWGGDYSGLI